MGRMMRNLVGIKEGEGDMKRYVSSVDRFECECGVGRWPALLDGDIACGGMQLGEELCGQ